MFQVRSERINAKTHQNPDRSKQEPTSDTSSWRKSLDWNIGESSFENGRRSVWSLEIERLKLKCIPRHPSYHQASLEKRNLAPNPNVQIGNIQFHFAFRLHWRTHISTFQTCIYHFVLIPPFFSDLSLYPLPMYYKCITLYNVILYTLKTSQNYNFWFSQLMRGVDTKMFGVHPSHIR